MGSSAPAPSFAARSCGGLVREVVNIGFRFPGLVLEARPVAHDKRHLIAEGGQLRSISLFVGSRRVEFQEGLGLISEAAPRLFRELLGGGGLRKKRSFVFVGTDQHGCSVLLSFCEG